VSFESSLSFLRERSGFGVGRKESTGIRAERLYSTTSADQGQDQDQDTTTETQKEIVTDKEKDKMASDEDYAAFLDKANQDPNEGVVKTKSQGKIELKATDIGVEVPAVLTKATQEAYYVSDADEPFVPVCLKLKKKGLPDEGMFLSHSIASFCLYLLMWGDEQSILEQVLMKNRII